MASNTSKQNGVVFHLIESANKKCFGFSYAPSVFTKRITHGRFKKTPRTLKLSFSVGTFVNPINSFEDVPMNLPAALRQPGQILSCSSLSNCLQATSSSRVSGHPSMNCESPV